MGIYDLQKRLNSIKYSQVIWTALVLALNVGVAYIAIVVPTLWSFYFMIVSNAILTLAIPYVFGEKNIKKLAAVGIVLLLISGVIITSLVWGTMLPTIYDEQPAPVSSPDGLLAGGTVTPYLNYDNDSYVYSVTYAGSYDASNLRVYLNITPYLLGGGNSNFNVTMYLDNPANASVTPRLYIYEFNENLTDRAVYCYLFGAISGNETSITNREIGPINVKQGEAQIELVAWTTMAFMLQSGMLFLIGLLMYWWLRKGKLERQKWKAELDEATPKKGGFKCTECGAEVGDEDKFCPKCGVKFDEGSKAADDKDTASGAGSSADDAAADSEPEKSSEGQPEEGKEP